MKPDFSHDLGTLLFISKTSFKNRIKKILENPLKTIIAVLKWVFYFTLIFSPTFIALFSKKNRSSVISPEQLATVQPYIGGGLLLLLLFYVLYTLKKAVDDYKPTIFKAPDANLLFSSPLNRRTIYLYAILRAMFGNLMTALSLVCFFFIITFSLRITIVGWAVPFAIIGLFSFGVFMQSFKFFINSLNKKLKSDRYTSFIYYLFLAGVIGFVLLNVYGAKHDIPSMISLLGSSSFEFIPFAGWVKGIIMGLAFPNSNMVLFSMIYLCCAVFSFILSVFWADDYYEDTITMLGEVSEIQDATKRGRTDELLAREYHKNKKIVTTVSIHGSGPRSFLWKGLLIYKKKFLSKPISGMSGYLIYLIIGVALAYFVPKSEDSYFILLFITFMSSSILASVSGIATELKLPYIFLTPGKLRHKLFCAVLQPIILFALEFLLLFLPMLFSGKLSPVDCLLAYITSVTMTVLPVAGGIILAAIFPDDEALKNNPFMAMLKGLFTFVYFLPGGIICGLSLFLTWLATHTISAWVGLLGFSVGNIISAFVILFVSECVFKRLEYRQ